ncbi:MAG: hypothetical protein WA791_14170, partial [Rhodomicrobium sp.]
MKRAITITGWQRPQLFLMLLESLAANDLDGWEVLIQLEPSEFVDEYRAAAAEKLSEVLVSITVNHERLGIRNNPYSLLSRAFDDHTDFVLYLEEDLLLAADATALAQWYAENHRCEWMCLSLLSGGCGSKGFISDRAYPQVLFTGKSFNSLGFAVRRGEWERHLRPAWQSDLPMYTCKGGEARGWDWSVYLHLITTPGLCTLQPAAARATHTGRHGVYCRPEFHDAAFKGLDLAEGLAADRSYSVLPAESMPAALRRQASLWDQTNSALHVINKRMPQLNILLGEQEELRELSILWAFRMFLGRDPEPDEYKAYLKTRSNKDLIEKMRASAEFQSALAQLRAPGSPKLPVDFMPNSQEAVIWAYVLLLKRKPENQTVIENGSQGATIGDIRRAVLG